MDTKERLKQQWDEMHGRRWNPVSQRLPDDETELLVAWAGTDLTVSYAVFRHVDRSGEQVWQDAYGCNLKQPTHWMPLPEPPAA